MAMKLQVLLLLLFSIASELTTLSVSNSLERWGAETEFNSYGYIAERKKALNDSSCSYQVIIASSCSSPNFTMENIAIRFGDALGNQVFEEKLIVPRSRTIEQCSLDIFQLNGACMSAICFVELYRYGAIDGWKPERVKIYCVKNKLPTLDFNLTQPSGRWFGYNWCLRNFLFNFLFGRGNNKKKIIGSEMVSFVVETVVNKSAS